LIFIFRRGDCGLGRGSSNPHLGAAGDAIRRTFDDAVGRGNSRTDLDDPAEVARNRDRLEDNAVVGADRGDGQTFASKISALAGILNASGLPGRSRRTLA
jgi:hypothetical protein